MLQKLLEVCYGFSQDNDIIFNSLKSAYVVFRPKIYKLFCPPVYLHSEKLSRIHETKYLGCFLSDDQSDDVEIYKKYALFTHDQTNYCECLAIVP